MRAPPPGPGPWALTCFSEREVIFAVVHSQDRVVVGGRHPALGRGALVKRTVLCFPGQKRQRQTEELARGGSPPDTSAPDQLRPRRRAPVWGQAEMRQKQGDLANQGWAGPPQPTPCQEEQGRPSSCRSRRLRAPLLPGHQATAGHRRACPRATAATRAQDQRHGRRQLRSVGCIHNSSGQVWGPRGGLPSADDTQRSSAPSEE